MDIILIIFHINIILYDLLFFLFSAINFVKNSKDWERELEGSVVRKKIRINYQIKGTR